MKTQLFREIASRIDAYKRCIGNGNTVWKEKHRDIIESLVKLMPSGSGIDCGTKLDWDKSNGNRLVFHAPFHHMDDSGMYDGWTDHTITVTPSLIHGIDITIGGRNRNDIKSYLHDVFHSDLTQEIEWNESSECFLATRWVGFLQLSPAIQPGVERHKPK